MSVYFISHHCWSLYFRTQVINIVFSVHVFFLTLVCDTPWRSFHCFLSPKMTLWTSKMSINLVLSSLYDTHFQYNKHDICKKILYMPFNQRTIRLFITGIKMKFSMTVPNGKVMCVSCRDQDQDQDSLLVKRRNDNHSPGPVIRELVPSSHQRSELSNTILCIFSE